jgi:hypothetical protein
MAVHWLPCTAALRGTLLLPSADGLCTASLRTVAPRRQGSYWLQCGTSAACWPASRRSALFASSAPARRAAAAAATRQIGALLEPQ